MKTRIILYLSILILICFSVFYVLQGQHYDIYIGKNVAKYSTVGNYNIVIVDSADCELQNIDSSCLFVVDYDCEFLKKNPEIRGYLKAIERFGFVFGGIEMMKKNRKEIWKELNNMIINL